MNKPVAIFGMVMSVLFVVLGIVIPFRPQGMFLNIPRNMQYVLGFILIAYGIFRFYRAYKMLKQE